MALLYKSFGLVHVDDVLQIWLEECGFHVHLLHLQVFGYLHHKNALNDDELGNEYKCLVKINTLNL